MIAQRRGQTGRQTIRRQPLPVLQRADVIVLIIRLEAAQQHLPFEEWRPQTDLLEGRFRLLVLAVFDLLKS